MKSILKFLFVSLCLSGVLQPTVSFASIFSVSPPSLVLEHMKPGTRLEKKILVTGSSETAYEFITKKNDFISNWIRQTDTFSLPNNQTEIYFEINVPKDTEFGKYESSFILTPKNTTSPGRANTVNKLGQIIPVHIFVGNKDFIEYKVNWLNLSSAFPKQKLWFLPVRGEAEVLYELENASNIEMGVDRIVYDVFEKKDEKKLETITVKKNNRIPAFKTERVLDQIPIQLDPGSYYFTASIFLKGQYKPHQFFDGEFVVEQKLLGFIDKLRRLSFFP